MQLFTVPFPNMDECVALGCQFESDWSSSFTFPEGYIREIKEQFPNTRISNIRSLHHALDRADQGIVRSMLDAYSVKLSTFTAEQIIKAAQHGKLEEIAERARQSVKFQKFLADLEKRYFPERIEERERRRQEALESWM